MKRDGRKEEKTSTCLLTCPSAVFNPIPIHHERKEKEKQIEKPRRGDLVKKG
jgi:hypothetical protein